MKGRVQTIRAHEGTAILLLHYISAVSAEDAMLENMSMMLVQRMQDALTKFVHTVRKPACAVSAEDAMLENMSTLSV